MVNKSVVTDCSTLYKTAHFVSPTAHSIMCINHFEEKVIKRGKKLLGQLHSVYLQFINDSKSIRVLLRTPTNYREPHRK